MGRTLNKWHICILLNAIDLFLSKHISFYRRTDASIGEVGPSLACNAWIFYIDNTLSKGVDDAGISRYF